MRPGLRRSVHCLLVLGLLSYFPGCSSFRPAPTIVTDEQKGQLPPEVLVWVDKTAKEGERNAVLNLTEVAAAALENRDALSPELLVLTVDRPLDEAIQRIEAIYADTPEARKARSLWHDEASKDFKGEPYERAFVFLLRGLRYYEAGDFDNARACFKSGIFQDCLSVEGEFNADMATFEYLIGLCSLKTGEEQEAQEAVERARAFCPGLRLPPQDCNLLVVAFVGSGPVKEQIGSYKEILLLADGTTETTGIEVSAPWYGRTARGLAAAHTDDMGFQARTRGGRAVDEINKRKACAKGVADKTAKIAALASRSLLNTAVVLALMDSSGSGGDAAAAMVIIAATLLVVAVVATAITKAIKSQADIRAISAVPGHIYLWAGRVLPGKQIIMLNRLGCPGGVAAREVTIPYDNDHVVVYFRCP